MAGNDAELIGSSNRGESDGDGLQTAPFALDMTYNPALLPASGPMSDLSDKSFFDTSPRGGDVPYAIGKPVYRYWNSWSQPNYTAWLDTLFRTVPPPRASRSRRSPPQHGRRSG